MVKKCLKTEFICVTCIVSCYECVCHYITSIQSAQSLMKSNHPKSPSAEFETDNPKASVLCKGVWTQQALDTAGHGHSGPCTHQAVDTAG